MGERQVGEPMTSTNRGLKHLVSYTTDGQTLGFALAKGLVRGLTRCPNPPSRFYGTTYFWMNVRESVLCLTVDTPRALDPVQMSVIGRGQP